MKRNLVIVVALAFGAWAGAEPSLNDNLDAQVIMAHYDKAVADAKKVYDIAIAKAAATAIKELQREKTDETKAGRLEVALAIKKKIEELQPLTAVSPAPVASPNAELVDFLVGEWTSPQQGPWIFLKTADGGLSCVEGSNTSSRSVKWAFVGKNAIIFLWSNDDAVLIEREGKNAKLSDWQKFFQKNPFGPVRPSGFAYWNGMALNKTQ